MSAQDTVKKGVAAFNGHNATALAALYASNTVAHDPIYPQPLKGRDAIRKDFETFVKAFPDIKFKVTNLIAKGAAAACEMIMTGTHKGPLAGPTGTIPPTNRRVELSGAFTVRVNAKGLIVEERRYYDTGGFMRQLGLTQ